MKTRFEIFRQSAALALIVRGILFIVFGALIIFLQYKNYYSTASPVRFLGILFLLSGALYTILSLMLRRVNTDWFWGLIWGISDLAIGVYVMFHIEEAGNWLRIFTGAFACVMAVALIIGAFYMTGYRIFIYINAAVSLGVGAITLMNLVSAPGLNYLTGLYVLLFGLFMIYAGFILISAVRRKLAAAGTTNPITGIENNSDTVQ